MRPKFKIKQESEPLEGLSATVAHYLRAYFEAHHEHFPPEGLYERILGEIERPLLEETLRAAQGNQIKAAQILGIHRNTLRRKIKKMTSDEGS